MAAGALSREVADAGFSRSPARKQVAGTLQLEMHALVLCAVSCAMLCYAAVHPLRHPESGAVALKYALVRNNVESHARAVYCSCG